MMKMLTHLTLCLVFAACSVQAAWAGDVVRDTLELSKEFQARPASLIEGKVSGVQVLSSNGSVNGDLFVHIRGLNSVRSDSQPLWIVDGAPTIGMFDLNPYDIESIEVLKDVSATAIYGLKGANGVILVNTKRQKQDGLKALEKKVFGEVVMGSDAFFPFPDNVEAAHDAGVRYIVQPGGSKKDDLSIESADKFGIAMVFTGMRHFRH